MPLYSVGIRKGAKTEVVEVVARTDREAELMARRQGIIISPPKVLKEKRSGGMSAGDRYMFLYQLATMVVARVPISDALRVIRENSGGRMAACAAQMEAGVASGRQFADLCYEDKRNFPGSVGLLIKAGSKASGGTAAALQKAAEFEREILGAAVKGAKGTYSAGFWVSGSTIGLLACPLAMTPWLQNSTLFKMSKTPVTWDWLDNTAYAMGGFLGVLMLFALSLFFIVSVGQRLFPEASDKIIVHVPVLREIVFSRDNFISFYRFALMIRAGVTLEEALETTWKDTRKGHLRSDLRRALDNVKIGRAWADGFRTVGPTDRAAMKMASDKDRLGIILDQVADQNRAGYIRRLEIIQPIMGLVGGLSMSMVYAVVGLYSVVPFSGVLGGLMDGVA